MSMRARMCFDSPVKDVEGDQFRCTPNKACGDGCSTDEVQYCEQDTQKSSCGGECSCRSVPSRINGESGYGSGSSQSETLSFDTVDSESMGYVDSESMGYVDSDGEGEFDGNYDTVDIEDSTGDDEGDGDLEDLRLNLLRSRLSGRESSCSPSPKAHVAKFLCPRFKAYEDGPSNTEMFVGRSDGEVQIESCGWEVQIFVDRKPEVICTDHIKVQDFDDGSVQINDFFIEPDSDLGCGSYCSFRLASCTKDHGLYALKFISKRKAKRNSMLFKQSKNPYLNIERETSILKKINHPNIVRLFEIMDDPEVDNMYFIFEYMDRGCILTIPTDTPLKESVAITYMRDALYGVEYLHSKNIIHRDLKPENMLLNSFGRVKLIDFGLSFIHSDGDDTTRLPYGTPSFTAPECLDEELTDGYSARAMEMWGLGCTFYALLFGQVPFYHDNLFELYRMIQEDPVILPTKACCHISLNVRNLLRGMLEKIVRERLTLKDILSSTVFIWKNSPHYLPERCKTCQYYSESCHPVTVQN